MVEPTSLSGAAEGLPSGILRLELPLPLPGVPPVNAWALADGDGVVLVDAGMAVPGALGALERGLARSGRALADVRLLVCTHAHPDHVGLAAAVVQAAGCELWMHPDHRHGTQPWAAEVARRVELGRRAGVPDAALQAYAEALRAQDPGLPPAPPVTRHLVEGVEVATDAGGWQVVETPGHAPSHVCLWEPDRRLLLSGDHLLADPVLHLDAGWTPDPIAELGASLARVERLGVARCLPGHGPPFTDVAAAVDATRQAVVARLTAAAAALDGGPQTAFELARRVFGHRHGRELAGWLFPDALVLARHLEASGMAARAPETWARAAPPPPG